VVDGGLRKALEHDPNHPKRAKVRGPSAIL
jgi:hypothetical protein